MNCGVRVEGHYESQDSQMRDDERLLTGRRQLVSNLWYALAIVLGELGCLGKQ